MKQAKLLKIAGVIGLLLFCLWAWFSITNSNRFPIKAVKVQSSFQHLSQQRLQTLITPYVTGGFFAINVKHLEKLLMQQPWVASVAITRVWPSKIIITITERQAIARWGRQALLDGNGTLFTPSSKSFPKNLPWLIGPDGQQPAVWKMYQQADQLLLPLKITVTGVDFTPRHAWRLTLSDGMELLLGRIDTRQRLQRFIAAYPKLFAGRADKVRSVDLRYPDGFAVKWKSSVKRVH